MAVRQLAEIADPVKPAVIEHRVDAARYLDTGEMAHYYNYIHYEFAAPAGQVEAIAYMEDGKRAIVTMPNGMGLDSAPAQDILAYLQLRFAQIDVRDESGNELLAWDEMRPGDEG